jgi:DNA-3-methyladenine glycosylase
MKRRPRDSAPRFTAMDADPVTVARRLLGQRLVRMIDGVRLAGTIVEVEAYLGAEDLAAHTFGGRRTPRNEAMYLPGGHAYVYFTYGMHHCLNVVCGRRDEGVAVLIRALEPTEGHDEMFLRRVKAGRMEELCAGPGRLTQALEIDRSLNGLDLRTSGELFIEQLRNRSLDGSAVVQTRRIGLNRSMDQSVPIASGQSANWWRAPLRFALKDNSFVSRLNSARLSVDLPIFDR